MSKNINARIALKRDTSANWTNYNPVLLNGELILVDTAEGQLRAKIGDGIKTYTQLPFTDEALRALITEVDNNNSAVLIKENDEESRLLDAFNIVELTQEEYDELLANNLIDSDTLYVIEEENTPIIVHADWENNDSETAGYIENRPFYENNNGEVVQLDEKFIPDTIARTSQLQEAGSKIVMTQNGVAEELSIFNVIKLTEEEYDAIVEAGTVDPNALYLTEGDGTGEGTQVVLSDLIAGTEPENLSVLNIIRLSQQEYDALVEADNLDSKAIYMTENTDNKKFLPLNGAAIEGDFTLQTLDSINLNSLSLTILGENGSVSLRDSGNISLGDSSNIVLGDSSNIGLGNSGGIILRDDSIIQLGNSSGIYIRGSGLIELGDYSSIQLGDYSTIALNGSNTKIKAAIIEGSISNDYAEYREGNNFLPGQVVCEKGDDTLILCDEDCAAGCYIVSDTFGFIIGETEKAKTPIAISGRVLAYTAEDRMIYKDAIGRPVCGTKGGRIRLMTNEEAVQFPWKILGIVSSVPEYKTWGEKEVEVNGRVWIKVR